MSNDCEDRTLSYVDARIGLITGSIGAGKSTVVDRTVAMARTKGFAVRGIWCPARLTEGRKTGIEAVDLSTGERKLLAVVRRNRQESLPLAKLSRGKPGGRYDFDPTVFVWANTVLSRAMEKRSGVLVIDEIGPVELTQGKGFAPVLAPLSEGKAPRALVVVRDRCLEDLKGRLRNSNQAVFTVTSGTRDQIPGDVIVWLLGD